MAQNRAIDIDSSQVIFNNLQNTDTTQILKTGEYILKHTNSETQKFKVLEKIAEAYFRVNNINKSVAYSFRAKEVAEKIGDPEMMAQSYGSIANQYAYLNLTEKARPYLNRAIEQIEKLPIGDNRYRLKALSFLELGNLDFNDENYAQANKYYRNALQQFNAIKNIESRNRYNYRRSLYNIGNSYYYLKKADSSEYYLNQALSIKDAENPNLKYYIYSTLAEVYTMKRDYHKAIDTLQSVLKDPDFDITSLKAEIYLNISRNYKSIGDKVNYAYYNEKHLSLRDSVEHHDLKAINTAFNAEQKDFAESILKSRQDKKWLKYCILAILSLSVGTVFYLNNRKKKAHLRYLLIINKLKKDAKISQKAEINSKTAQKTTQTIPTAVEEDVLNGLRKFEEEQQFRNTKLTLSLMAVALETNPAYLSSIIKNHKDQNFNNYINELRIDYICQKIHTHPEYVKYKISYLAEDSGFTSHSTFSTIFKKVTGISPSEFLTEAAKNHNAQ